MEMMQNEEYLNMTPTELVFYIRSCHPKHKDKLPGQLESWVEHNYKNNSVEEFPKVSYVHEPVRTYKKERFELFLKVVENHRFVGADEDMIADYCVSLTDKLMLKFEQ